MSRTATGRTERAVTATSRWLPIYIRLVVAIGVAVIAWSVPALGAMPHPFVWLLFATLALLTGVFTMKAASVSYTVSVTDTFFIASAMLFGPGPATIAVALNTGIVSYRRRHAWERIAFNTAAPALSMWVGAQAFFRIAHVPPLVQVAH